MGFMGTLSVNMYEKYRRVNERKRVLLNWETKNLHVSSRNLCVSLLNSLIFWWDQHGFHLNIKDIPGQRTEAQCSTLRRMAQQREKMELHLQGYRRHHWDNMVLCASLWQFLIKMISIVSSTFLRTFRSFTLQLLESILYFLKYFFHIKQFNEFIGFMETCFYFGIYNFIVVCVLLSLSFR